jgi:hypothetical protein
MRCTVLLTLIVLLSFALLPSVGRGAFLNTTLDGGSFTTTRGTDPSGANTFVIDRLFGHALGNNLPVPIGQSVTVNVALPTGTAIRVAPGIDYSAELTLGALDVTGAGLAGISSFTGSVTANVNGGQTTRTLPFFNEAIVGSQTIAFIMTSQSLPAAGVTVPSLIDGFTFTFNIGPLGLLNRPALLADELRLNIRASSSVPNAQAATLPTQVSVVPEPAVAIPFAFSLAAAALCRRARTRG